jgi:hypothetical protein
MQAILMSALLSLASPFSAREGVYEEWRDYLALKPAERSFEDVGWRGTFWSAVQEAERQRKPVLLWAMNGHPLACT